jgi:hypothetical protein
MLVDAVICLYRQSRFDDSGVCVAGFTATDTAKVCAGRVGFVFTDFSVVKNADFIDVIPGFFGFVSPIR